MLADLIINLYSGMYIVGFFSVALPVAMMVRKALINLFE